MSQLASGLGWLDADVAVEEGKARHVVGRSIADVQGPETLVSKPAEHPIEESDRLLVVEYRKLNVVNAFKSHIAQIIELTTELREAERN